MCCLRSSPLSLRQSSIFATHRFLPFRLPPPSSPSPTDHPASSSFYSLLADTSLSSFVVRHTSLPFSLLLLCFFFSVPVSLLGFGCLLVALPPVRSSILSLFLLLFPPASVCPLPHVLLMLQVRVDVLCRRFCLYFPYNGLHVSEPLFLVPCHLHYAVSPRTHHVPTLWATARHSFPCLPASDLIAPTRFPNVVCRALSSAMWAEIFQISPFPDFSSYEFRLIATFFGPISPPGSWPLLAHLFRSLP